MGLGWKGPGRLERCRWGWAGKVLEGYRGVEWVGLERSWKVTEP